MATITAGGINTNAAPSPIQRQAWHDDWNPQLANLTAWVGNPGNTSFSCTTTSSVAVTEGVAEADLQNWVNQDLGHRHFSIA